MAYGLGFETFRSKTEIANRVKGLLEKRGRIIEAGDIAFLADLILMHPDAVRKIGSGIEGFSVRTNPKFPKYGSIWLHRSDGSETDFSYRKCLQAPTAWGIFTQVCRHAIGYQIDAFKKRQVHRNGLIYCPIVDDYFSPEEIHVDHRPPHTFDKIIKDFVGSESLEIESVEYSMWDGKIGRDFADHGLKKKWQDYHEIWSDLWVISEIGHKQVTRERRQKK